MKRFSFYIGLYTLLWFSAVSQDTVQLTIENIVNYSLEKNFDLKISEKNQQIASNNVSLGNASYLPTVTASGSYNYSVQDTRVEFASPNQPPIDESGAGSETLNASVTANYNVFSGGSRNYTFQKLQALDYEANLQNRQAMEQVILNAVVQYLDVINQYQSLELTRKSVNISRDRYDRAMDNYEYGVFSKLEMLNAEVDLRNDSTSLFQTELNYQKALQNLVLTIGLDPRGNYKVDPEFEFSAEPDIQRLLDEAKNSNTSFQLSRNSITTAELDLKNTKSRWFPRLDISAAYQYSNNSYDANFISTNQSSGLNAGVSLSYDIFNGNNRSREQQNTKVRMEIQEETLRKTEYQLTTNLVNTYNDLTTSKQLLSLSERNIEAAEANYERSKEAFASGQITGIQLREAQLNLLNALNQQQVQKIQAKIAEVNLKFYSGELVKEE